MHAVIQPTEQRDVRSFKSLICHRLISCKLDVHIALRRDNSARRRIVIAGQFDNQRRIAEMAVSDGHKVVMIFRVEVREIDLYELHRNKHDAVDEQLLGSVSPISVSSSVFTDCNI